jgi:hypothetical protein
LRPALRAGLALLGASAAVFALPVVLGLLLGVLFPLLLVADRVSQGAASRALGALWVAPEALSGPYLAALCARGPAIAGAPAGEAELGRRFVALLAENLGEPGFRELVVRVADLDRGRSLAFALLRDGDAPGEREDMVDLRAPGQAALLFDAIATGLLFPLTMPLRRVSFPRGALHPGETHRLTDATLVSGCGIEEALAAGAEQVVVVTGAPEEPAPPARRRGPLARIDATLRALEQQAAGEIEATERTNRIVATLGHRVPGGRGAWEDPATGQLAREVDLWVIRPRRRTLGPAELDGALDPATEVLQTTDDLMERGFRDAYRQFIEPVVGQAPLPGREEGRYRDSQAVGL